LHGFGGLAVGVVFAVAAHSQQQVQWEEAQRGKYTFLYEKGQRIPLVSLREKGSYRKKPLLTS
jgi:hypothetical protein